MRLSLYEFRTGAETLGGHRVVYDVANDTAFYGEAHVEGHALVWQLDDTPEEAEGALLSRRIQLDPFAEWVVRCDRIDFPPGGVAYTPHASRAGDPLPAPRRDRHPHRGPHGLVRAGRRLVRGGPRSRARDGVAAPADRVRPRPDPARRVGREAHDPLRRPGRRGPPEAPEADRLPRAPRSAST